MGSAVQIVGAGLAGTEAAWQLARRGIEVVLYEMRPVRSTAAHKTGDLAELVCSNSLRSDRLENAAGLLKAEMRLWGSLILSAADASAVPAGSALAVDRTEFARQVTQRISQSGRVQLDRREVAEIPASPAPVLITSGPLTSEALAASITQFTGEHNLYFYDAIAPVVEAESIDRRTVFQASRYQSDSGEPGDYLNCPLDEAAYDRFYAALMAAAPVTWHKFEAKHFFEGCLPVEELARRGRDTLRFGPMKPVGLKDPRNGRRPHAVVQLRQDNRAATHYNMVGFQNHLKWGDQARILRLIPGLEKAEFVRFGQIHRNSFIKSPVLLTPTFQTRKRPRLFFAGQIAGVEGYLESAAAGLMAATAAAALVRGETPQPFPRSTALGALAHYISEAEPDHFVPTNIAFGLLPPWPEKVRDRRQRKRLMSARALEDLAAFKAQLNLPDHLTQHAREAHSAAAGSSPGPP